MLVATVHSARSRRWSLRGRPGVLVADECHRMAGEANRLALGGEFEWRLGLSAVHARPDGAHETVLGPYFGGLVYRCGYARALGDGVVAPFAVATIAVDFEAGERGRYEHLSEKVHKARWRLIVHHGLPGEPYGEFMARVEELRHHGTRSQSIAGGRYLSAFNRRRELLAETRAKAHGLAKLEGAFGAAARVIVFTQTLRASERAVAELVDLGVDAQLLHGRQDSAARGEVLARFAKGHLHTIVAPQVLDEGLDVPDADLAVVVAASRQRRQMVQRLGRVLRPKADGRHARLALL